MFQKNLREDQRSRIKQEQNKERHGQDPTIKTTLSTATAGHWPYWTLDLGPPTSLLPVSGHHLHYHLSSISCLPPPHPGTWKNYMKLVPDAKKVVDSISIPFKTNVYLFRPLPQELAVLLGSNL